MQPLSPGLLIIIPLFTAFLITVVAWIDERYSFPLAVIGLAATVGLALHLIHLVLQGGTVTYYLAGWPPPFGIEFRIDLLNAVIVVLIAAIALGNLIASRDFIHWEFPEKKATFLGLYLLFVTGLLGVLVTADLFNLYVLLEITSLSAYTQIALASHDRAPLASLNYVFLGVIGASFYLLGTGYLYIMTGSLNMADISTLLTPLYASRAIFMAFIFCIVGIWIKMALFPLHVWLPNAYTYAPITSSRLMAPLMTKVMIYVMIRLMISVFGLDYLFVHLDLNSPIIWLSVLAILAGGILALGQTDLKKMLTYIIVSEIGYMVGGAWLGNQAGLTGAILHIINDALMTFCLFLVMGNLAYKIKDLRFSNLQGLFKKMPLTMSGLVIAGLSIIGVPPTCGFFSKWYLITGAIQAGKYEFMIALLISSLINAILFFRLFEIGYFEPQSAGHGPIHGSGESLKEAPVTMLFVLGLVAFSLVLVGLYSGSIITNLIVPFIPEGLA